MKYALMVLIIAPACLFLCCVLCLLGYCAGRWDSGHEANNGSSAWVAPAGEAGHPDSRQTIPPLADKSEDLDIYSGESIFTVDPAKQVVSVNGGGNDRVFFVTSSNAIATSLNLINTTQADAQWEMGVGGANNDLPGQVALYSVSRAVSPFIIVPPSTSETGDFSLLVTALQGDKPSRKALLNIAADAHGNSLYLVGGVLDSTGSAGSSGQVLTSIPASNGTMATKWADPDGLKPQSVPYASTITLAASNASQLYRILATGNLTLAPPTGKIDGAECTVWITASGRARTVALGSSIVVPTSTSFSFPVTIPGGKKARFVLQYDAVLNGGQWELAGFASGF
jgi:hypothetical protein